jgi:signal transduction histidine kinase
MSQIISYKFQDTILFLLEYYKKNYNLKNYQQWQSLSMTNNVSEKNDIIDQNAAAQMVTLSLIIIVVALTLVSFTRIYSNKQEQIINEIKAEAKLIEAEIVDHLNYAKYFVNVIGKNIMHDYNNLDYIHQILSDAFAFNRFNQMFGWKEYRWVNEKFQEIVSTNEGIISNPRIARYIEQIIQKEKAESLKSYCHLRFHSGKNTHQNDSLKIIHNLYYPNTEKYLGSVFLKYDIDTLVKNLDSRKKGENTNFVIINSDQEVIAQSDHVIDNIAKNKKLDQNLLRSIKVSDRNQPHLDMINGLNYFISKIKDTPFTIIINIDNNVIKQSMFNDISKKFVEVCIFATICLFIVIAVYRRETRLRTKAEKATAVAENIIKAKTDVLAFTAHEIRSPLGFIQTGSELMKKEIWGKLLPEYKKYAEGIYENSNLILEFINDILDENQIIGGKFKVVNASTDIQKVIDESIKLTLTKFNKRKVTIEKDIAEDLPLLICDGRRILQALVNLISNSIKYSDDHTTITISAKVIDEQMEIRVMDQGIGMKEQDIPVALSAYGTLQNGDYRTTGSYGLGLTIVKILIDAHEAILSISSVEKKGTTVKMTFPKYKLIYNAKENNYLKK